MTYEPGTADIMTTMPPPFPGELTWSEPPAVEFTPSGWKVKISKVGHFPFERYQRIDLYAPSGALVTTLYSPRPS